MCCIDIDIDHSFQYYTFQVLDQLKRVNFSRNGYHVSFNANGDPVAFYELINWQKNENGGLEFVTVDITMTHFLLDRSSI